MQDTTKTIDLKLKLIELDLCLNIIKNSTFEAKYAELVLGMKRKIEKLLPASATGDEKTTHIEKKE